MKTIKTLFLLVGMLVSSTMSAQNNFSEWLYLRGDKPVQFRLEKTKVEGNKVFYKIHLRLNKEGAGYCTHELCYGYVIYLPIYEYDTDTKKGKATDLHFKIPKEFTGEYTIPSEFYTVNKSESNGFNSYWDHDKNYPMQKIIATGEIRKQPEFLLSCVDTKRINKPYNDYCNFKGFKESEAIEIK
uniref:hypothetical protein n=1 Tax=Flavobacterium sp. TaxID=239 RepID=UPI0040499653